jgi:hypothetical protein
MEYADVRIANFGMARYAVISFSFLPSQTTFHIFKAMKRTYGLTCTFSSECNDTSLLKCTNGYCSCPDQHYWTGSLCGKSLFLISK